MSAPSQAGEARNADLSIQARIAMLAAIATVTLFSVMGTVGYLAIVDVTKDAQREEMEERLDAFEARLASSEGALVTSQLQLDSSIVVIRANETIPLRSDGTVQVSRSSELDGIKAIVGTASTVQADRTFAAVRRGLWISVAVAGLLVGAISWFVVDRALAPVRRLTAQAKAVEADPRHDLLEVDASGDELAELASTFNGMLTRVRSADHDRRRFVSDASHELRTPLMVISADAEYALDHDGDTAELAESVLGQSERLTALVNDLLTLAAIDEGQPPSDAVRTVGEVLASAGAQHLAESLDPAHAEILIPDVSRSVANIVANATRHRTQSVELTICPEDESVAIVVDDDGPGIPPADREQIFKRFYRPDSGRNRGDGGAGLGLAIARAEVGQVGGVIVAESSPLGGARFTISVPRLVESAG